MTKHELAKAMADAFETAYRPGTGDEFIRLKEGSPDWMRTMVQSAHGDFMPDDVRYSMIRECVIELADWQDWDETHMLVDGRVDIYNHDRLKWLASSLKRAQYCDDAREEGLVGDDADMFQRIAVGQYMEYQEIVESLVEDLSAYAVDTEEESD